MTSARPRSLPSLLARALGLGVLAMIALPVIVAFGALAIGHLAGGCGPGSSGGCEMGAAALGLYAVLPSFLLAAVVSLLRDQRKPRS